jgi:hypothetical protein
MWPEVRRDQWIGGEFTFDDWLIDSIWVGTIEIVDRDI